MLSARRMALVIEVVQQRRGGVEIEQGFPRLSGHRQAISLRLPVPDHAGFHRECVLAKALALGPFPQQAEGLLPAKLVRVTHYFSPCCYIWFAFLRVFRGMMGTT